ncbi:DUF1524 domain-containing protein [Kocuria sp.]|uniref:GmrSD restriction endonuclease domain-containing protein n=1 Tax=Kocuria sp. TaxID=1871328 RepID=UPI0026DBE2D6|nr:DUF1524 domain-containing protein [Kocuria sp.]MDO4918163.1 DUF1524 domain-containing protein [Kocuria sp.]
MPHGSRGLLLSGAPVRHHHVRHFPRIETALSSPRTSPAHRLLLGAAALALALAGCSAPETAAPSATTPGTTTTPRATSAADPTGPAPTASGAPGDAAASSDGGGEKAAAGTALAALDELPVKGRAPKTGYSRDEFGPRWADTDHNGCDTRNDILRRDLTGITVKPGTHGCNVATGELTSLYTGQGIDFVAGERTSSQVQIDHVVALSDAWQKGAQQLDAARRTELANDPLNLVAVDGPSNNQKSDADAATWLPSATGARCEYVATQIAVKQRYELWVTDAEKKAMTTVLDACPDQTVPQARAVPAPGNDPEAAAPEAGAPETDATPAEAAQTEAPGAEQTAPAEAGTGADEPAAGAGGAAGSAQRAQTGGEPFARCADARAAGAAPLYAGSPGYSSELDGDGDGVACETGR